jgi:hypothetical protein
MPWVCSQQSLTARVARARRRTYNNGLLAGKPAAPVEWVAGEPELHHPGRGRVEGMRAFEAPTSAARERPTGWSSSNVAIKAGASR